MLAEPFALPRADQRYVEDHGISIEPVTDGSQSGVILRSFVLPKDRYQVNAADILILLPPAYPDVPPDMFYADPWLRLKSTGGFAKAADQPHIFVGRKWQRWSRHSNHWRSGLDGLRTFICRITTALEASS